MNQIDLTAPKSRPTEYPHVLAGQVALVTGANSGTGSGHESNLAGKHLGIVTQPRLWDGQIRLVHAMVYRSRVAEIRTGPSVRGWSKSAIRPVHPV